MDDLYESQVAISEAIKKLTINIKKDGADRKSVNYFKKRMDMLEAYWLEYENNHDRIITEGRRSHMYFINGEYDKVFELYKTTKAFISKEYQEFLARSKSVENASAVPGPSTQPQQKKEMSSEQEVQENPQAGTSKQQEKNAHAEWKVQENQPAMIATGSNSKLDEMLKRQASNFRAFQRTTASINLDAVSEKWEFEDILRTLQSRWSVVDTLHWELDSELEGSNLEYECMFSKYERTYEKLKRAINSKLWSVAHRNETTPRMEIPTFQGSYHQWIPFKDLFTESIHSNASLSKAQKMQFLKTKVKGEAERLIQHLQISCDNYQTCWEILNHRYNNVRMIFTSHVNILMNLPIIQQASVHHIKRMHDTTLESLNAIKNLGVDTSSWDPLIVHILLQKLDAETHNQYLESLKQPRDLPKLQEFLEYLESKFTSLESSRKKQEQNKTSIQSYNNSNQKYLKSNNNNSKHTFSTNKVLQNNGNSNSSKKCPICCEMHGLYLCKQFLNMSAQIKRKTIAQHNICQNCLYNHNGKACFSEKRCRECGGNHNSLLHEAFKGNMNEVDSSTRPAVLSTASSKNQAKYDVGHVSKQNDNCSDILLATAIIKVQSGNGSYHKLRALIDQGSQASLISEKAAQLLALPRQKCSGVISGVGTIESRCKGVITLNCASVYQDYTFNADVFIMNSLIKNLPTFSFSKPDWSHLEGIQLADPEFHISRPIDILLGAEIYSDIILNGISRAERTLPVAQQTRLGWILCGNVTPTTLQCNVIINEIDEIKKYWDIEDISDKNTLSVEDSQCVEYYKSTTKRREDGSYEVRIPFKENFQQNLGTSKHMAIAQFRQLERRFIKNKEIERQYSTFMNEYKTLGHMTPCIDFTDNKIKCYLPHHAVLRNESTTTALRVVFNASKKTSSGFSLNDLMLTGPNLQQDLQTLLIKWRQYKIAFSADIEKAFRFIWINEEDQRYQSVIWRDTPLDQLQEYRLTTVTYGTRSAPFLLMMSLKQLAVDEKDNFPNTSAIQALEESFYMDDVLHGAHSVTSAINLKKDLIKLLKAGKFNLRKWKSNSIELSESKGSILNQQENFEFKQEESTKTLGLRWNTKTDSFEFQCILQPLSSSPTKRTLLSDISKVFDPLGWLSPVSTKLKLLFQAVWNTNIGWDDELPSDVHKEWLNTRAEISNINQYQLSRWLGTLEHDDLELHGFCDASNKAYACVIYSKISQNGINTVSLVAGKARLVPTSKSVSLPRLELSGAHLLARLMAKVQDCLVNHNIKTYCWTDSMVVLGWLHGDPGRWKTFVSNRVKQVKDLIPKSSWNYVKSAENPADCASRGMSARQLQHFSLWWKGPSWLSTYKSIECKNTNYETDQEVKLSKQVNIITTQTDTDVIHSLLSRYSSIIRLSKVFAWTLRFINNIKSKTRGQQPMLTLQEINIAKHRIIKYQQSIDFISEINCILQNKQISSKSKILELNPFIDPEGLLRVGGRLRYAKIDPGMKHPIVIPHSGHLTNLIIDHAHKMTFHGGTRVTLANIRQTYWIVGGNRAVKKRIRDCIKCHRFSSGNQTQLMGDLPSARCNMTKPFHHTGVDFTGHVMIKTNKGRGVKTSKGYVAVFICMTTKIVHLELVSDLTSSAFMAALRRMAARRGTPRHIYSDNGTNFIGANKMLQDEYQHLQVMFDQDLISEMRDLEIEWHFNAPSWPSAGGLWEAAVKSLKFHLKRVINDQKLTYEEFSTILAQLEAVLNSRPLCSLTEDPDDLEFLTPSSFINIKQSLNIMETETDMRTRWYLTQKIVNDIWKRWYPEYLSQLTARSKWRKSQRNLNLNDIVLIKDTNLPPGKWAMGRVVELHPGADNHVRVVTLKTKNGLIKRPIVKTLLLPINKSEEMKRETKQESRTESSGCNNNNNRKNIKHNSHFSFISLAMTIMYFFALFTKTYASYNITSLKENQGLYLDKISNMQLIRDEWKIVAYYDMNPFWLGTVACNNYIEYLNQLCAKLKNNTHCEIISTQLKHEYSELEYYNHLLLNQHSAASQATRRKRGLINGVGYLANSLFGVLDQNFAEQYQQDIQLLRDNDSHLSLLIKNQTSVIEAEYNILRRTEDSINKQYKSLNRLSIKLDLVSTELSKKLESDGLLNDFTLGAVAASNLLRNLKYIQSALLDTVTDIYHGRFNYHLLSPNQLRNELSVISSHISKDLSLPINNLQENLTHIYHLFKVKARMTDQNLIFEIKFPLVSRDSFEIMKIIPIPLLVNSSSTAILTPISEYVGINLKKDFFLLLSKFDLTTCLRDDLETYLCYNQKPLYVLKGQEKFCESDPVTLSCELKLLNYCTDHWIELNTVNKYVYFCCDRCRLRLLCEDQITAGQLSQSGILTIDQGCLLKTENMSIYSHKDGISHLNIKKKLSAPDLEPINHLINWTIPIIMQQNLPTTESNEKQFNQLKTSIDTLKDNNVLMNQVTYHDIHHYAMIYIVLAIVLITAGVTLWWKVRANYSVARRPANHNQETVSSGVNPSSSQSTVCFVDQRKPVSEPTCVVQCEGQYSEPYSASARKVNKTTSPVLRNLSFLETLN